jgi:hypothetical protein
MSVWALGTVGRQEYRTSGDSTTSAARPSLGTVGKPFTYDASCATRLRSSIASTGSDVIGCRLVVAAALAHEERSVCATNALGLMQPNGGLD